MIGDILKLGNSIIDKLFPDKVKADEAKIKLAQLEQDGEFKKDELRYKALGAEAGSNDKWTSRARPSFLYVMYIMILASLPMGVLYAYSPTIANNIAIGMKEWLAAIPKAMWVAFEVVGSGYVLSRSIEKAVKLRGK